MIDIEKRDWLFYRRRELLDLIHKIEKQLDEDAEKVRRAKIFQYPGSENVIKAYQNANDKYMELCSKFHETNDWIIILGETGSTDHIFTT